jgi:orotidine-5'-phosphate decarboxylase
MLLSKIVRKRGAIMDSFMALLESRWNEGHFLCVGLDTDYEKLPGKFKQEPVSDALFHFNREIIEATAPHCGVFKPNVAFYEGYGLEGLEALIKTNRFIRERYPVHPIILDAKRADIGNTNTGYVKAAFEVMQAHAITVHPYLGKEALAPFLGQKDRGVFVLCHTSNPGAGEFQELKIGGEELFKIVAGKVGKDWNHHGNCGLVMGATYPKQLAEIRDIAGDLPLLIPGIGAQGGDLQQTVISGLNQAKEGIIINASRSILYASSENDFAAAAAAEAAQLTAEIRRIRDSI